MRLILSLFALGWLPFTGVVLAGELSARVVVTDKGAELFNAWETNPDSGFTVIPVNVAKRGVFLSAVVLFTDCAPDPRGDCNAEVDITAYDPNGKVYGRLAGEELWRGKPAPQAGLTQLSVGFMGLVIEPQDPSGTFKVVATARDLVSGKVSNSETSFQVE